MQKISKLINLKCGIYCIFNLQNGKKYIGSSVNLYSRLHEHLHNLKYNKSYNQHLQNAWNKYGKSAFDFSILEFCDENVRFDREQYYINTLKPEYNLALQVVANFGHSPSQECRNKISNTLKEKYKSGEITTYKQDHAWVKCFVYSFKNFSLLKSCKNLAEALDFIQYPHGGTRNTLIGSVPYGKYCIIFESEFQKSGLTIKDYILKYYYKCLSPHSNYLISEDEFGNIVYHKSVKECSDYTGVSKSMIFKHLNSTRNNPYRPNKVKYKIYFSNDYILQDGAVCQEESYKLLSGNIGETPIL